jgi:hypothetical protein
MTYFPEYPRPLLKSFALLIGALLCVNCLQAGTTAKAADYKSLEVRLKDQHQSKQVHVLSLGRIAAKTSTPPVDLEIANIQATPLTIALVCTGSMLRSEWVRQQPARFSNKMEIAPGAKAVLRIKLDASHPEHQDLQLVTLYDGSVALTSIVVEYQMWAQEKVDFGIGAPNLTSGTGENWSDPPYLLCSGKAPLGYTFDSSEFTLRYSYADPYYYGPRDCTGSAGQFDGSWVRCANVGPLNGNSVCYQFQIQGWKSEGDGGRKDITHATAVLHARYKLDFGPVELK